MRDGRVAGMLVVNAGREESVLQRWSARALDASVGGSAARAAASAGTWPAEAFRASSSRPLLVPFLILVLLLVVVEGAVAGAAARRRTA